MPRGWQISFSRYGLRVHHTSSSLTTNVFVIIILKVYDAHHDICLIQYYSRLHPPFITFQYLSFVPHVVSPVPYSLFPAALYMVTLGIVVDI